MTVYDNFRKGTKGQRTVRTPIESSSRAVGKGTRRSLTNLRGAPIMARAEPAGRDRGRHGNAETRAIGGQGV